MLGGRFAGLPQIATRRKVVSSRFRLSVARLKLATGVPSSRSWMFGVSVRQPRAVAVMMMGGLLRLCAFRVSGWAVRWVQPRGHQRAGGKGTRPRTLSATPPRTVRAGTAARWLEIPSGNTERRILGAGMLSPRLEELDQDGVEGDVAVVVQVADRDPQNHGLIAEDGDRVGSDGAELPDSHPGAGQHLHGEMPQWIETGGPLHERGGLFVVQELREGLVKLDEVERQDRGSGSGRRGGPIR